MNNGKIQMQRIEAGHYTSTVQVYGMNVDVELVKFDGLWNCEIRLPNHCSESCSFWTKSEAVEWASDVHVEVFHEMMDADQYIAA